MAVDLQVVAPDGRALSAHSEVSGDAATLQVLIKDPQLWWPNGYGEQPLYRVEVTLSSGGQVCDRRDYQIGLRTIRQSGVGTVLVEHNLRSARLMIKTLAVMSKTNHSPTAPAGEAA